MFACARAVVCVCDCACARACVCVRACVRACVQVELSSADEELVWREDHEEPLDVDAEEHHAPASPSPSELRLRGGAGASDAPAADEDVVVLRLRGEGQEGVVAGDTLERGVDEDVRRLRSQGLRGGGGDGDVGEEWRRTSGAFGLRADPAQEAPSARSGGAAVEEEGVRLRGAAMSAFAEVRRMGVDLAEGR